MNASASCEAVASLQLVNKLWPPRQLCDECCLKRLRSAVPPMQRRVGHCPQPLPAAAAGLPPPPTPVQAQHYSWLPAQALC